MNTTLQPPPPPPPDADPYDDLAHLGAIGLIATLLFTAAAIRLWRRPPPR